MRLTKHTYYCRHIGCLKEEHLSGIFANYLLIFESATDIRRKKYDDL
jgi:hypothetical protein